VIGDQEMKEKLITVTVRAESKPKKPHTAKMKPDQLIKHIHEASKEKPFRQLTLPKRMSMWPIFI
jgi:threonyl-tRNA synthetase